MRNKFRVSQKNNNHRIQENEIEIKAKKNRAFATIKVRNPQHRYKAQPD